MKNSKISRARHRRFNKKAREFISLLNKSEKLFLDEWDRQVHNWIREIHRRAQDWRKQKENKAGVAASVRPGVFGVLDSVDMILAKCGQRIEKLVGAKTRSLLTNECIKAVAAICDKRFNNMVNNYLYRRATSSQ